MKLTDEIIIDAPTTTVWEAIKNPAIHAKWHPFVTHIAGEHELGAVRKCDVIVGGKAGKTEERCALYKEGQEIGWLVEKDTSGFSIMVSDWVGGFSLAPKGPQRTVVTAQSTFVPKNILVRLMMPMIMMKFHQTQKKILAGLKAYVEKEKEVR